MMNNRWLRWRSLEQGQKMHERDKSDKIRKAKKQKKASNELIKGENFSRLNRFEKIKVW